MVGFTTHCKNELGWSMSRVQLEWNFLKDKAGPDDMKTTVDRVTGDQVEWLHVNMEEYSMAENEIAQTDAVEMQGTVKKKPTSEDHSIVCISAWALTLSLHTHTHTHKNTHTPTHPNTHTQTNKHLSHTQI